MDWIEKIVWHEVTTRPPTEEEIEGWAEWGLAESEYPAYIFDCELPDDQDEILILLDNGWVQHDVCSIGDECGNCNMYYLENLGDWDDVIAWAYIPTGKREMEDGDAS